MNCILCNNTETLPSIEHIIPESMGNKKYFLPKGHICENCNNLFSKFEKEVLSNTAIGFERTRFATPTKKGKLPFAQVGKVKMEGTDTENIINLSGMEKKNVQNLDPETGTFQVILPGFQGNEMPVAKFLLKVGYLSLFKSKKKIFNGYDFSELKDYLLNKSNIDWPFVTTQKEVYEFDNITSFTEKYYLKKCHILLLFNQLNNNTLLFRLEYGGFKTTINLLNRQLDWLKQYSINQGKQTAFYPAHIRKNL